MTVRSPFDRPAFMSRPAWRGAARDCFVATNARHGTVLRGAFALADGGEVAVDGQCRDGTCDLMLEMHGKTWRRRDAALAEALADLLDTPDQLVEDRMAGLARDAACVLVARRIAAGFGGSTGAG